MTPTDRHAHNSASTTRTPDGVFRPCTWPPSPTFRACLSIRIYATTYAHLTPDARNSDEKHPDNRKTARPKTSRFPESVCYSAAKTPATWNEFAELLAQLAPPWAWTIATTGPLPPATV
jgi:hypothetical protein